jgi:hypothetical protein
VLELAIPVKALAGARVVVLLLRRLLLLQLVLQSKEVDDVASAVAAANWSGVSRASRALAQTSSTYTPRTMPHEMSALGGLARASINATVHS